MGNIVQIDSLLTNEWQGEPILIEINVVELNEANEENSNEEQTNEMNSGEQRVLASMIEQRRNSFDLDHCYARSSGDEIEVQTERQSKKPFYVRGRRPSYP